MQDLIRSDPSITPQKGDFISVSHVNHQRNPSPIREFDPNSTKIIQWLLNQVGLGDENLAKIKEQKINDGNIAFLSYDDLKNMGFPIGPSR